MLHEVAVAGYEITPEETEADVVIINTCGFIESAKEESIEAMMRNNHSLKALQENRSAVGHEVDRAKGGWGPRVDVVARGGFGYLDNSTTRSYGYDSASPYSSASLIITQPLWDGFRTLGRVREFVRDHPTVYCGTHTPQGYENLEAKRVMDLDHPVETIPAKVDFSARQASGRYVCSICGYVYDPAEHDGVLFEDLPEDWKCPRCKQPKEKFNKA